MKKIKQNLKNNLKFILSAIFFMLFIINPFELSKTFMFIFVASTLFLFSLFSFEFKFKINQKTKVLIDILTYIILVILFVKFKISWSMSDFIIVLSNILGVSRHILTYVFGFILFFTSSKFVKEVLKYIIYSILKIVEERIKVKSTKEIIINLKSNFLILVSALAYFCCEIRFEISFFIGLVASFLLLCLFFSQIEDLRKSIINQNKILKITSLLATLGLCIHGQNSLLLILKDSQIINLNIDIILMISIMCSIISSLFIYVLMSLIYSNLFRILKSSITLKEITTAEKIIYILLFLLNIIFVIVVYNLTDGFYGTSYKYDFIYTSDSPSLVRDNAYLSLTYLENDIRQPLFAIFASPFIGIPYFISKIFNFSFTIYAILINVVQIIILFFSNYLLVKMLNLSPKNRVCFILLINFTYTHLLSVLMMEQYIISYFWLMLFFYSRLIVKKEEKLTLWASGGTLLTNFSVLPFLSKKNIFKDARNWLIDMIKYVIVFILILITLGRFDLFLNLNSNLDKLSYFTGKEVIFIDQIYQYFSFLSNIFIYPDAGENISIFGDISWQLNSVTTLKFFGVVIFGLSLFSLYLNKKKRISLVAGGWILLSLVMLLGFGWGTRENGLILYVLYFGWAFFILLFQLLENINDIIKNKYFIPVCTFLLITILLYFNVPALYEMIKFSIEKFPL